jgi:histidinol-phosphate phosphatase family protein
MRGPIVHYTPADFPQGINANGAIVFIDRDGVLNVGKSTYINNPSELEILNGSPKAIGDLRRAGFRTCIVTNQSPLMRGLWDENELFLIHQSLREKFLESDNDAKFDIIITCPHRQRDHCSCRKPNPGMLRLGDSILRTKGVLIAHDNQSIIELDIDHPKVNWWNDKVAPKHQLDTMIGDRNSDMGAGWAIGARLFKVPDDVGISFAIERILDKDDSGDRFDPIR